MKLKILSLVMKIPEAEFFSKVAGYLSSYGYEMEFVSCHKAADDVFIKTGLKMHSIHEQVKQLENGPLGNIKQLEAKYKIANIRSLYIREMLNFQRFEEDKILQKTINYLMVMDKILDDSRPDIVIQETGDFIAPISLYYAARAKNINHIFIEPSMLPKRVVFTLNHIYANVPPHMLTSPISDEALNLAEEHIKRYQTDKIVMFPEKDRIFFKDMSYSKVINVTNIKKLTRKLFHKYIAGKQEEYDAIGWYSLWHLIRVFRRKRLNRFYTAHIPEQPYIYFPFHVPLDLQLTTRSPEYLDQLAFIEYLSRCLPYGYLLLIKEHPASIGAYSSSRIKTILKYNNVRLMHPGINSYDIINKAKCIVTVNSKVGAEAIMQQKPVVVVGESFYRGKGLTVDVERLKQLPYALDIALKREKLNFEEVKKFVASIYQWSRPGELFYNSEENIKAFSDSILEYMKENHINC